MTEPSAEMVERAEKVIDVLYDKPALRNALVRSFALALDAAVRKRDDVIADQRTKLDEAEKAIINAEEGYMEEHALVAEKDLALREDLRNIEAVKAAILDGDFGDVKRPAISQLNIWLARTTTAILLTPAGVAERAAAEQDVIKAGLRQRDACRRKDVLGIDKGFVDLIAALDRLAALTSARESEGQR